MTVWVALLRGINVGAKNRLPMAELRSALADAGLLRVSTYIQSGNVIFTTGGTTSSTATSVDSAASAENEQASNHAATIRAVLVNRFGLDTPVATFPAARLAEIRAANPFPAMTDNPKFLHVYFAQEPVADSAFDDLDHGRYAPDEVMVVGGVVYVSFPNGVARSKLTNAVIDRAVGQPATGRNWSTVTKLTELTSAT